MERTLRPAPPVTPACHSPLGAVVQGLLRLLDELLEATPCQAGNACPVSLLPFAPRTVS